MWGGRSYGCDGERLNRGHLPCRGPGGHHILDLQTQHGRDARSAHYDQHRRLRGRLVHDDAGLRQLPALLPGGPRGALGRHVLVGRGNRRPVVGGRQLGQRDRDQTAKDAKQTAEQASKDVASWADKNKAIRRVFTSTPTPPYDLGDLWVNHPVEEVGRTHNELSAYTHDALSSFNEEELSGDGELTDIYVCTTARATGDYVMTDWVSATSLGEEFRMMRATYATNAKIEKLEDSIVSTVNGELTYTAPDGSTQTNELATKVKQTDTSLTATISRTDALETMVHEYSGGVLVSKIKNGATVNGALVNADGSFDVVNVTWNSGTPTVGKKLMRLANNSIEFNNPDTSYNICKITANGTITNIDVPNGSLAIDEMPAWCQALGDSGYDSFIAGKMLQLGAGNRTTYSEILIEPDGTTIDGYKFALGTNNTTDTWVPVIGGNRNAGYLVHRAINLKWGPNAYAVYGAYNPNNGGDHYYTTNVNEYNKLLKSGWTGSGVYFYAAL